MTQPDARFPELDDDDRRTVSALERAFAPVAMHRPSPVTSAAQDADTASRLAAAFEPLVMTGTGTAGGAVSPATARPPRRRRRGLGLLAAAAAMASLLAGALVLGPPGSATAWAADPRQPDATERAAIDGACGAPLARGLGALQGTGSASRNGSAVPVDPQPAPEVPVQLPPLVSLDLRGDIAFAIYQDAAWTVTCVARSDGDAWRDQGVQVGPGTIDSPPGLVATGSTTLTDGETITTVSGSVPPGTTRVTFRLDDGTEVRASVMGSTWAAWFPGAARLVADSLVAYDATGRALPLAGPA